MLRGKASKAGGFQLREMRDSASRATSREITHTHVKSFELSRSFCLLFHPTFHIFMERIP